MDCCAYCTASSFQIKSLFNSIRGRYKATLYRDVVHIEDNEVDVFYFPYGAIIAWGISLKAGEKYVEEVEEFQHQPLKEVETDNFTYAYDEKCKFIDDNIYLPDENILSKIAISHGLAQSVKLGAFEDTITETFNKTKQIPEDLAKHGKIPLSRKQIRKKMGELFIERSSINLHVDVLDTPEFFWEHPELEPLYLTVANELEIETRGHILNQRLDVVKELFEMLGNELNHQHSSRLEWIIIILIVMEVIISLGEVMHLL